MRTKLATAVVTAVATAGILFTPPAYAGKPPPALVRWSGIQPSCEAGDGFMTIGAAAYVKEIGKNRVRGFKVQYLLYYGEPGRLNPAARRKTVTSTRFPDDTRSYEWTAPRQSWGPFVAPDQTVYLVVKATWDRVHRNDWDQKFTAAVCSG